MVPEVGETKTTAQHQLSQGRNGGMKLSGRRSWQLLPLQEAKPWYCMFIVGRNKQPTTATFPAPQSWPEWGKIELNQMPASLILVQRRGRYKKIKKKKETKKNMKKENGSPVLVHTARTNLGHLKPEAIHPGKIFQNRLLRQWKSIAF